MSTRTVDSPSRLRSLMPGRRFAHAVRLMSSYIERARRDITYVTSVPAMRHNLSHFLPWQRAGKRDTTMLRLFKAISGPYLNVRRQRWALFQICGSAGMLLALAMAAVLTVRSSLSIGVMGATAFAAVLTFFVLAMGTKI